MASLRAGHPYEACRVADLVQHAQSEEHTWTGIMHLRRRNKNIASHTNHICNSRIHRPPGTSRVLEITIRYQVCFYTTFATATTDHQVDKSKSGLFGQIPIIESPSQMFKISRAEIRSEKHLHNRNLVLG